MIAAIKAPAIDYEGLAPLFATMGGSVLVLMAGLLRGHAVQRRLVPFLTLACLGTAIGFTIANWEPGDVRPIIENALDLDTLALGMSMLFFVSGIAAVLMSMRSPAVDDAGSGEYHSLLLGSISGMVILAGADNLVTVFVGLELLSIPLYVLCASRMRSEKSLEAGIKYLVIGSVGSATLLYGLALIYGATGATDFEKIAQAIGDTVSFTDPLLLTGIALSAAGLAFKASIAPFHQWTPDVYQGAPTPITAFMAVATKAAAFAITLRLFDLALVDSQIQWSRALAALAVITIIVGNVGAVRQSSLKRMLGWSGVAQAGYMLTGVVVGTKLGLQATVFYLAIYLLMNLGAFAVVLARERVSGELEDDIRSLEGLGTASPWLAWPMTICMLGLAGFPATAGFVGKFYLIDASVDGDFTWLGIAIVVGSIISLGYYLRVVAVMWMGHFELGLPTVTRRVKAVAGWSPEADARAQPEVALIAVVCAAAVVGFGIIPSPLFDAARDVGSALAGLS